MASGGTIIRLLAVASALAPCGCTAGKSSWTIEKLRWLKDPPAETAEAARPAYADHLPGSPVQHEGLARAEDAYRREEFARAEDLFEDIADDTRNRSEVAERARFYQAECLRRQDYYPKAADTYHKLLLDFPAGLYREQAVGQMYLIASEWLQPVRDEIAHLAKPEKERKPGSWASGIVLVNFDRKLPTVGTEERALQTLERVYFNDPTGPYADKALFMLGRVHLHRENYKESARYFQQLAEAYDRSPLRDESLKLAIIAKNASSGGPQYDSKDTAEAMRLINAAKATSPALAREGEGKFLDQQALMVRYQQAQKDFETAEFYRRTGHAVSAWFYYELVQRRYPGIKPFAEQAVARQAELKAELEDMKNPSTASTTRRFWKEYVLGHELPAIKDKPAGPEVKDLPAPRPEAVPAAATAVPADIRPR